MGVDNSWASITELIKRSSCGNDDLPLTKPNCNGETSLITLSTILLYTNLSKIFERIQSSEIGR